MNINLFIKVNKEEGKVDFSSKEAIARYIVDKMHTQVSDSMTEEEKEKFNSSIDTKLRSGKKLSKKEEQYLKKTNPRLYMEYMRIRARAEAMAEQLKHARTKQEVNNIITTSTASVSDKDPAKEYILAAMHKVAEEFKSTRAYQKLPNTSADLKKKNVNSDFEENSDEENEDFDPMNWSPLQEIIDTMPQIDVPV